ncbi:hypothetical protein [Acinetobacter bereziniae]|uniref:hypothetical protein n=1 Tax=Acinetobacter bereziniae TaxID=106648 RepID=UPI001250532F|nr:hypothetical protein [Acinetobacter bereziniae]
MEWVNIIIAILGLSVVNFTSKWFFSKKFRESLRKNDFKNIRVETDEYNNYIFDTEKEKEPWQLQNATNQYLGTDKFHYSLIKKYFKKSWDFRDKVRDLNFSLTFIKQHVKDEKAYLMYRYHLPTLKRIEKYNIWICVAVAISYILAILFEVFLLEKMVTSFTMNEQLYNTIRTIILGLLVVLLPLSVFMGSKASVAIGLKQYFEIKEKN